uniref:hypothetical protein n=1 Tax=Algoriphagus sp. TaxID=1872435 RepID=UPI00258BD10E|nr:hypothetical protein [Algoriphagus sp.]
MRNTKFVFDGDGSWEVWRFPGCRVASAEPSRSIGLSGCPVVELSGWRLMGSSFWRKSDLDKGMWDYKSQG